MSKNVVPGTSRQRYNYAMDDYDLLKVSIQSALVGEIPDNLFAVTCGVGCKRIVIAAYFDSPVSVEESHLLRRIACEVAADFPDSYSVEERCYSLQQTELRMLDFWAFLRASSPRRGSLVPKSTGRLAVGFP
jgi:hypothetical protein